MAAKRYYVVLNVVDISVASDKHSLLFSLDAFTCDPDLAFDVRVFVLAVPNLAVLPDRFAIFVPIDRVGDRDDARDRKRLPDLDLGVTVVDHLIEIVYVALTTCLVFPRIRATEYVGVYVLKCDCGRKENMQKTNRLVFI